MRLRTERLDLVAADLELARADLAGTQALSGALGARVPASWPPELYEAEPRRQQYNELQSHTASAGWWTWYLLLRAEEGAATLIGIAGFKGPPTQDGAVEIGYSVVADHQRRGFAVEAVNTLVGRAFEEATVTRVIAQTLEGLTASIRVLEKCGFAFTGEGSEKVEGGSVIQYERRR